MTIDQAHEQNNAVIKGDGGAIGLTEDSSALRRWMVAGPEISQFVTSYKTVLGSKDKTVSTMNSHQQLRRHSLKKYSGSP